MRTVRTKVYSFNELSNEAQQTAIEKFRNNGIETDFIYDDAEKTVEAFNSLFGTSSGRDSWLDVNTNNFDDDVLNLKGFRLQKYLWNNYGYSLFIGKYYGNLVKTFKDGSIIPISKEHPAGLRHVKRNSNVLKENSCVLTGMCYDNDLLQPIYEFLQKRDFSNCSTTFYDLLNECFYSLKKSIENEIDYRNTDEAIIEDIQENDYEFTKDGNQF